MKTPRGVRFIKVKADSGSLKSNYQLWMNYNFGLHVEKDSAKASHYFSQMKSQLKKADLRLNSIQLVNFRAVHSLKLELERDITVIVGDNGTGKSSFLDAINYILSWITSNVIKESRPGLSVKDHDIAVGCVSGYAAAIGQISTSSNDKFRIMLAKPKDGSGSKQDSELVEFKALASIYRHVNESDSGFNLPVFAHYSVARLGEGSKDVSTKVDRTSESRKSWTKLDAYDDLFKDRSDFNSFYNWFIRLDSLVSQDKNSDVSQEKLTLKSKIKSMEAVLSKFSDSIYDVGAIEDVKFIIDLNKNKLKSLEAEFKNSHFATNKRSLSVVKNALMYFIPTMSDIWIEYSVESIDLLLKKNGRIVNANYLSQGEKSIFSLVGDLARRLVMLNPTLKNPLLGHGIVLIDEIDLHLHPTWQQIVIDKLLNTFPNVQFVITTHSPQVLSTVEARCIRMLKENSRGEIVFEHPLFETKGVASSDVLSEIMGTDTIPPIKEAEWVSRYTQLLDLDQTDSDEALEIKKNLISHFGEQHPINRNFERMQRLKVFKNTLLKK